MGDKKRGADPVSIDINALRPTERCPPFCVLSARCVPPLLVAVSMHCDGLSAQLRTAEHDTLATPTSHSLHCRIETVDICKSFANRSRSASADVAPLQCIMKLPKKIPAPHPSQRGGAHRLMHDG